MSSASPTGIQPRSVLLLLFLSFIWGASFLLIRIAGTSFPPLWIALLRASLGGLLLWAVLLVTRGALPQRKDLPLLLAVAFFNNAVPFICFAWGEQVVPSNTAAVLNATTPIWTLLLSLATHRRGVGLRVTGGIVLGFLGVVAVVSQQHAAPLSTRTSLTLAQGVALILCGALGYAVAATIAKARLQHVPPLTLAASQLGLAACLVAPFALTGPRPEDLRLGTLLAIAVLGLAGSGLAYLLFFRLLATLPATQTVAVTYLLPIWGIFWGALARESVGVVTYVGVAIVIAGLVLMNWPARAAHMR